MGCTYGFEISAIQAFYLLMGVTGFESHSIGNYVVSVFRPVRAYMMFNAIIPGLHPGL